MEQPYIVGRLEPNKYDYRKRTKEIVLYSYYEKWRGEDDYEEETEEDRESWDHDQPRTPTTPLKKLSLQDIIDMLPAGISPADIKMRIYIDSGDMGIYGQSVTFFYVKTFPADIKKYQADMAKYQERYNAYKIKKDDYDQWVSNQEKKKLELQFEDLRKKLDK